MTSLTFVDEHAIEVAASPGAAWAAVLDEAAHLTAARRGILRWVLATEPPAGFAEVARSHGERLVLAGRHRFSRYRLTFILVAEGPNGCRLAARTEATFPGPHGRVYRWAVIGSRSHVLAVRAILASITRRARSTAVVPA